MGWQRPAQRGRTVLEGTTGTTERATMSSMEHLLLLPHLPATHSPQLAITPPQLGTSSHLPAMMQGTSSLAMQQQDHQATTRRVPADTRATSLQRLVTEKLRPAVVASTCRLSLC